VGGSDGARDIEQGIADLVERLPARLIGLARLAYNYRWSWMLEAPALFHDIDPVLWRLAQHNPRVLLESVPPRRLRALGEDPAFLERYERCVTLLDGDLHRPPAACGITPQHPVVYFCSEFGIHSSLPLYGGGLGILAGDILKAASDLAFPLVGMSLLYRHGYFHQKLDLSGYQQEYWTTTEIERTPAALVRRTDGNALTIELSLRGRRIHVQIWRLDIGRIPLYLLDTDRPDNHPIDRCITGRLYVGDRHTRLTQYAVLGIAGIRALRALGIEPGLVHLNEGHAAFSGLERLRELLDAGTSLGDALAIIRRHTIFTTHTPVPAGNEAYSPAEIEPVLADYLNDIDVPRADLYDLGRVVPHRDSEPLNLTAFALRMSNTANGVSQRHGEVARAMWATLWPDRHVVDVPITAVTNGVHVTTWMAPTMQNLIEHYCGSDWLARTNPAGPWLDVDKIPDTALWETRGQLRWILVELLREASVRDRLTRGEPLDYAEAASRTFDPNVLTIGFARRVATYKRLYLLAREGAQSLMSLLGDETRPIQLVIAGKAHPQDHAAKEALRDCFRHKHNPKVAARVIFLEDYDLRVAPTLVAGVDLWLNLPRPPLEASGTSGMKVVLNGGVNLSVLDGWWAEACDGQNGWGIESVDADPHTQDEHDAVALFSLLTGEVIPLFYERDASGIPRGWVRRIKASLRTLLPRFSANRMMREYVGDLYPKGLRPG
jgi:starch phosphorylase